MQPFEQPTGRNSRLALVALALLLLLAVVAFASRSGFGHSSNAQPTPGYVNYAFTAFLIVFVLAIPVAVWGFMMQAREGGFQRKSFRARVLQNILTAAFFVLIGIVIVYIKRHHGHIFGNDDSALQKAKNGLDNARARQAASKYNPRFEWTVFWIALVGLTGAGAALYAGHRRRRRRSAIPLVGAASVAEDLAAEMSDAIEDLEAEPDARRAVIAAYARMEGVLARHGLRRLPSETPLEYMRRVLLGLTARADAVKRLTSLFEQAKFSRHEIDSPMKLAAIGALREIRDDLRGARA
jgi:uncharacterized protein DUF4129